MKKYSLILPVWHFDIKKCYICTKLLLAAAAI